MDSPDVMMRLRPHHILCVRFLAVEPPGRGDEFIDLCRRVRELISSDTDALIEVTEGVDDLCGPCPHLGDGRCISPFGDEEQVRKWDARLMEGLGLHYGDRIGTAALKGIIDARVPLPFCKDRCPWRSVCMAAGIDRHD